MITCQSILLNFICRLYDEHSSRSHQRIFNEQRSNSRASLHSRPSGSFHSHKSNVVATQSGKLEIENKILKVPQLSH